MSALELFPILTLFFISEVFFSFKVLHVESYIPLESSRVRITFIPESSNKSRTFLVILKFIASSDIPELLTAPTGRADHALHLKLQFFAY